MIPHMQWSLVLVALVAAATFVARRASVPSAILLVIVGGAIAFVPGLPALDLDPGFVLLFILPPLIYSAGVATSWPDFRRDVRPITLLAVGGVLFTTGILAVVGHHVVGLPWPAAIVLGAIISPPDVIAPMAVVGRVRIPRRLVTILNGEGLVNDVTALVLVAFSTEAVVTGGFSAPRAALTFVAVLAGEFAWGYGLGAATLNLRRRADDSRVEITLSLLTPFAAFWLPHALGGSGVLAAAVAGLHASWHGPRLISAATRLQGTFFWNLVVFILTGIIFLLTGLQAKTAVAGLGDTTLLRLLVDAVAVCAVAILARFAWVYVSAYVPPLARRDDRPPGWRAPFLVAFTGIRGVVSMVAALSIPLTVAAGGPFPGRELIIFLTFVVIVATLVVQGLALPRLIHRLGLDALGAEEATDEEALEFETLGQIEERALERLDAEAQRRGTPTSVVDDLRIAFEGRRRRAARAGSEPDQSRLGNELELALIGDKRGLAWERFAAGTITDEARRRIEHELDLEEARIRRAPNEAIPDGS